MTLARIALPRLIAVGMAYVSGTALNAALGASTAVAAGYVLFALGFLALAFAIWKVAGR